MLPVLIAVAGMVIATVADLGGARAGLGRLSTYGLSLLSGLTFVVVISAAGVHLGWGETTVAVLLYGSWWFAFLNLVQSLKSSLRVHILYLLMAHGGRIRESELLSHYNNQKIVSMRLDRLMANSSVIEKDGKLYLRSVPLAALVTLFRWIKVLVLGRPTEFGERPS